LSAAVFTSKNKCYNAAVQLVEPNLEIRSDKVAVIDNFGSYSFSQLYERVNCCANVMRELGIQPEQRVLLCLLDTVDFPSLFLGAIKAGIIPVPLNTLWTPSDYAYALVDSRAKAAFVSAAQFHTFLEGTQIARWKGHMVVSGAEADSCRSLAELMAAARREAPAEATRRDDICFWLYSSGSTGTPKATMHLQTSMVETSRLFAQGVIGISESDVIYSAAKLFFAYGLGNALSFPLAAGATSILFSGRPTPDAVTQILSEKEPTIFCGVPTLFASLLTSTKLAGSGAHKLRLCTSAGEALPADIGRRWKAHTGVDIIDGLGSTEMLHIFLSNRPGRVQCGTTGYPVPGYRVKIVGEHGDEVRSGEIGELHVSGPTAAIGYWNNSAKNRSTFLGEWVRTGDKYRENEDGSFVYCGRTDDMFKVGGIWVSPAEVEAALIAHPSVLEAAVVGGADANGLVKTKAFVVLKPGYMPNAETEQQLKAFVKNSLAPYKYPRFIEFLEDLPKTATGKLQRYLLRRREQAT